MYFQFILFLKHLWCQGNNLGEVSLTKLSGYRAKDASAFWVILVCDNYGSIIIEPNI